MAGHSRRASEVKRSRIAQARTASSRRGPKSPAATAGPQVRRSWTWASLPAICAVFAIYYLWQIRPQIRTPNTSRGAFTELTDGFLSGHTYLNKLPAPELLRLEDPYDPVQNQPYRLHDASLFKGKFYYYFGAAPVVLLYLPFRWLTGVFLPDKVGAWLFAAVAYAMACLFLRLMLQSWWPRSPRWLFYFLCVCLGFSNAFPFLLLRPAMYETAILAGQCFVMVGLYAMARSALGLAHPLWMAALGGAALAAAFGSRAPTVLAVLAFSWFLVLDKDVAWRGRLRRLPAALVPFAAGAALVLFYNYVRFDSPFEFGNHYQLAGINVHKMQYLNPWRIVPNLWISLLAPPGLRATFPFLGLAPAPATPFHWSTDFRGVDDIVGIVWLAPLVLFLAAAPAAWKRVEPARRPGWLVCVGTLVLMGAAWMGVDGMLGTTMRYQAEFTTVFFLAAALVIAGLGQSRAARQWLYAAVLLGLMGAAINFALGISA